MKKRERRKNSNKKIRIPRNSFFFFVVKIILEKFSLRLKVRSDRHFVVCFHSANFQKNKEEEEKL